MKNLGVMLGKIETVYNTDPVPSNIAANVLLVENVEFTPVAMETDDRNPVMPNFGQNAKILGGKWGELSFEMQMGGGGLPLGTPPASSTALRACGIAETIVAATSVTYSLISVQEESATFYYYVNGVRFRFTGARGTVETRYEAMKAPRMFFKFKGLRRAMTDNALITPALPTFPAPLAVNFTNTTISIDGINANIKSLSIDHGNEVTYRNLTNVEEVFISGRQMKARALFELPLDATQTFLSDTGLCTLGTPVNINIVHGGATGTGLRVRDQLQNAQLLNPKSRIENGILMLECDIHPARLSAGNDEWTRVLN